MKCKRNCQNCFNLRVKLPVRKNGRIIFGDVEGYCSAGELRTENDEVKIFKDILRKGNNLLAFRYAEKCPWFEGEDNE